MTYADDVVTMISTLGSWSSPAIPSPIYAVYDNKSSIKAFIDTHKSALEIRHADNEHIPHNDNYETQNIEVPCVLSGTDQDNLESVTTKITGIVNKYNNTPSALNGTTYTYAFIPIAQNTSAFRTGTFVMNFIIIIGFDGVAKTIEA